MSYPHITTPQPSARELALRGDVDARSEIQRRIRLIQQKMLDACEQNVEKLVHQQETSRLARADERRQFANLLHASQVCAKPICRRRRSCQGDPLTCLRVLLPVLGLERAAEHLLARCKRPRRR